MYNSQVLVQVVIGVSAGISSSVQSVEKPKIGLQVVIRPARWRSSDISFESSLKLIISVLNRTVGSDLCCVKQRKIFSFERLY